MRVILVLILAFLYTYLGAQAVTVDEFCLSNSFEENGEMNGRPLYGPIAGIHIFWDESEKWMIASLDKTKVYYTSDDSSTGPGCSSTFTWTAPDGSVCESLVVSGMSCSTILPVEYLQLSANSQEELILVSWKTSLEIDNEGFEIQRSLDGKSFQKIGWVNGHGTTTQQHAYEFLDRGAEQNDIIYYRLIQYDYNGHFEYSKIINVEISRKDEIKGSWSEDVIVIRSNANLSDTKIRLFNVDGSLIASLASDLNKGENRFNFSNLPSGVYILTVEEAGHHHTLKLSKPYL